MGTYAVVQTFPVVVEGNTFRVTVPAELMRGSPRRWGYQVLVMSRPPGDKLRFQILLILWKSPRRTCGRT